MTKASLDLLLSKGLKKKQGKERNGTFFPLALSYKKNSSSGRVDENEGFILLVFVAAKVCCASSDIAGIDH